MNVCLFVCLFVCFVLFCLFVALILWFYHINLITLMMIILTTKAYACLGSQPSVITQLNFKQLAHDCGIVAGDNNSSGGGTSAHAGDPPPRKMSLSMQAIDIIFVRASRGAGIKGASAGAGLTPLGFLEAIVRLAKVKPKKSVFLVQPLNERFSLLQSTQIQISYRLC